MGTTMRWGDAEATPRRAMWLLVAAGLGSVHAAASAYWALGGVWLLDTVGQVGERLDGAAPATATTVLVGIVILKLALAWVPVVTRDWIGVHAVLLRKAAIFGGLVLAIYGVVLTLVGLVALTGVLGEPTDPVALRGHAFLWDPLFAAWGVTLLLGLSATSRPRRTTHAQESRVGRERPALVSAR